MVPAAATTAVELAAVLALLDALATALAEQERRAARVAADERELATADGKAEQAEGRLADAEGKVAAAEDRYRRDLTEWQNDERRSAVAVRDLLTGDQDVEAIATLPTTVRLRAAPIERTLADQRAERQNAAASARAEQAERIAERGAVAAKTDPEPPAPHWHRDSRAQVVGMPLWRLVDVQPDVDDAQRAGLEAGLQAAGLLDALVLPDGTALDAGTMDVVLAAGRPVLGPNLARLLRPSIPDGSPVDAATVTRLLTAISARPGGSESAGPVPTGNAATGLAATGPAATGQVSTGPVPTARAAAVGIDGWFRLGPLSGRSAKPAAQYLGATARAAERLRLLAVLDEQIELAAMIAEEAEGQVELLVRQLDDLRNWLAQVPTGRDVLDSWQARTLRAEQRDEARAAAEAAARRAESRVAFSEAWALTQTLADRAGVAPKADLVTARRRDADEARRSAAAVPVIVTRLRTEVQSWIEAVARAVNDRSSALESADKAESAKDEASLAQTEYQAAMAAADPELKDLAERIGRASSDERQAKLASTGLQTVIEQTAGDRGRAEQAVAGSADAVTTAERALAEAQSDVRFLAQIPGLIDAAFDQPAGVGRPTPKGAGSDEDGPEGSPAGELPVHDGGAAAALAATPEGPATVRLARRWVRELDDQPELSVNVLHKAAQEANTTAAADNDPRISEEGGLWSAQAEHNGVTGPITDIVRSLGAAVAEDRRSAHRSRTAPV